MRVNDKEMAKIKSGEIKRLEQTLELIDVEENALLQEFDSNIASILGELLVPILKEINQKRVVVNGRLVHFVDTINCSRIVKTSTGDLKVPDDFLQVVHKSYLSPKLMNQYEAILKRWFSERTEAIRDNIKDVNSYDDVNKELPRAYALASLALTAFHKRPNMILRDVQKLTGIAISEGDIAELGTGEGKTLSAVLPVFLQALRGKGAHVITANSYLARRDYEETLPIFEGLGLTSGYIPENEEELAVSLGRDPKKLTPNERVQLYKRLNKMKQIAYRRDITYGAKATFAFDYLRDNGIKRRDEMVQRVDKPGFALIDEVDDALVDAAQVPYRISENTPTYMPGMSLRDLCIAFNVPVDPIIPKVTRLGLPTENLTFQEASHIAKMFLNKELLPDQSQYQELAQAFFQRQRVLVCEDQLYGFKTGKDLYNEMVSEKHYDFSQIKAKYGVVYCREKREFMISDHAYEGFLKFCYFALHINTDILYYQKRLLADPKYKLGVDYNVVRGSVVLTSTGANKIIYDKNYPRIHTNYEEYLTGMSHEAAVMAHYLQQAAMANLVMVKNQDYTIDGGKVKVMKNGRIQEGSTYSNGLHQAIEIKEGIPRSGRAKEMTASSSITQKDFYQRYDMFSGMTGTSAKKLFYEVYGKATIEIPKHAFYSYYGRRRLEGAKKPIGVDRKDTQFALTLEDKVRLIVKSILESRNKRPPQPVLLVVSNVEELGYIQAALRLNGISFNTLTGNTDKEKEAEIIALAGRPGMVTLSTEMAGRGTDIKVGGDRETIIDIALRAHLRKIEQRVGHVEYTTGEMALLRSKVEKALMNSERVRLWSKEDEQKRAKQLENTGLKVISSGYFRMSRVDRQLEGRTGRNGISGECERYVYPDDLKRIGIGSIDGKNSVTSYFKKFKRRKDGSLRISGMGYSAITGKVRSMQEAYEDAVKENIKNTQALDSHATKLVEDYREKRRQIICDQVDIRSEAIQLIENAIDAILASFIDKEHISKNDLLTPLQDTNIGINLSAICLEVRKSLGVTFDPQEVLNANINVLELRKAIVETAVDRLNRCRPAEIKQALLMKYDYMIKNLPVLLEHSFIVKRLTSMSAGMENQADANAAIEFHEQRQKAILEASKTATKHLMGLPLTMDQDKRLEQLKEKRFGLRYSKDQVTGNLDAYESDKQENNLTIAKRLREIKYKVEKREQSKLDRIDRKIDRVTSKGKSVSLSNLYKNLNVRPMKFISSMIDGKKTTRLVLTRQRKEIIDEEEKKL